MIDDRLAALEARLTTLEAFVGLSASRPAAPAPEVASPVPPREWMPNPAIRPPLAVTSATSAPAPIAPPAPKPAPWSQVIADLEEQLTGRALAVTGGVALVVGAIFFLSLAFSRGWIGPEGRVLIGIGGSGIALTLGGWMLDHRQPLVGRVLVAVGLAVISLSMFAATRLYHLVPVEVALGATLIAAVGAAWLAVRHDAEVIAVLAIVALLGAPPVLGASPNLVTVAFIGSVLVGFAALSLYRTWRWLPSIAFALSAPQVASWLRGDGLPIVLFAGAVVFWLLNVITAGGEEYLRPRNRLRAGGAMLLLANAAFFVWAGFLVLSGSLEPVRGPFLIAVALGHLVVGGIFLLREGDRHPFGMLAAGTGVAALAMAAPVQFGGPPVPIAWAAQAAALAWIAGYRSHVQAALGGAVLGALAVAHVVLFEYPLGGTAWVGSAGHWPFIDSSGLTLAFLIGAAAVAAWFLRTGRAVAILGAVVVLLAANAVPHELRGPSLIAGWVLVALAAVALDSFVVRRLSDSGPIDAQLPAGLRYGTLGAAAIVAAITFVHVVSVDMPIWLVGRMAVPAVPFTDDRAITIAALVMGTAVAGWIHVRRLSLELAPIASLVAAGLILAYGSAFEVRTDAAIVIAAGLAAAGFLLADVPGVDVRGRTLAIGASFGLLGVGLIATLSSVAPVELLTMDAGVLEHPPFISGATATLGALALALSVAANRNREERFAPWAGLAAGLLIVYLLSIGVVDVFQARIGGPIQFEELARQAQLALSVLWVVLGTMVFVFGLARRHLVVRQAGLALLAIASVKVFIVDLGALDVAYRVLSLVALGTFLLLAAWVYTRWAPGRADRADA